MATVVIAQNTLDPSPHSVKFILTLTNETSKYGIDIKIKNAIIYFFFMLFIYCTIPSLSISL